MANKFRKKPTIKEIANVLIEVNNKANKGIENSDYSLEILRNLDHVLGLYIEWKGDLPAFNSYIKERIKEGGEKNDSKKDEEPNKGHIPANTNDERSGSEGIRKEEK